MTLVRLVEEQQADQRSTVRRPAADEVRATNQFGHVGHEAVEVLAVAVDPGWQSSEQTLGFRRSRWVTLLTDASFAHDGRPVR